MTCRPPAVAAAVLSFSRVRSVRMLFAAIRDLSNGTSMPDRHYLFYELTNSLCATWLRKVEAKGVSQEGDVDVVLTSGGGRTIPHGFFAMLDAAKQRPIQHLMVNTNGVRIATDADLTRRLKEYMPGFEVYLQFDSLEPAPLLALHGQDPT